MKSYAARLDYLNQSDAKGQPLSKEMVGTALEEMIEAARKSVELDQTNADAHFLLAQGLYFKYFGPYTSGTPTPEQHDEIIRALEKSVELDPHAPLAESSLGDAYFDAGRYEDAIASYERRLKLNPPANSPRFQIARAYARLERFQDAVDVMRKALKWQQGARIGLDEHRWSMEALKCVEESKDTGVSLKRSACLFASYASALFSTTAYKWDSPRWAARRARLACRGTRRRSLTPGPTRPAGVAGALTRRGPVPQPWGTL